MRQFENVFLFYLVDPVSGDYYYIDNTDSVALTSTPTYLQDDDGEPQAPDGWMKVDLSWQRSIKYWGLYRNFTDSPFTFSGQAARILAYIAKQGSTAKCRIIIKKHDYANLSSDVTLNTFYTGDLNFLKYKPFKKKVTIPVKEAGLRDLFYQNENVTYEIPLSGSTVDVALDGITLQAEKLYVITGSNFNYTPRTLITPPINWVSDDGDFSIGDSQTVDWADTTVFTTGTPLHTSNQWFFEADFTMSADIVYDFDFGIDYSSSNIPFNADIGLAFVVFADSTMATILNTTNIFTSLGTTPGTSIPLANLSGSISHTLNPGNVIVLRAFVSNANSTPITSGNFIFVSDGEVRIRAEFQLPFTLCTSKTERQVFEDVVDEMTGGLYTADSTFFTFTGNAYVDTQAYRTVYTSGDSIRRIAAYTGVPDKLKIRPGDFFDNVIRDYGGGICIENDQVVFKLKSEILDKTNLIGDLGEVRGLEAPFAEDLLCNMIEAGNDENEYDYLNGKDEFMNKGKWKTALENPAVLDLVRRFRYDVLGIETFRYKLFQKNTKDNSSDNSIFVMEVDYSSTINGGFVLYRPQNSGGNYATGILYPSTKFNISKSPARVLNRNADYVQGMLYFEPSSTITFQSTEKNDKLDSDLGFGVIVENTNVVANTLGGADPLFIPIYFEFECYTPTSLIALLNANPNGYFTFTYGGVELKGFPMSVDVNMLNGGVNKVKLLCHPDVDPDDIILAQNLA